MDVGGTIDPADAPTDDSRNSADVGDATVLGSGGVPTDANSAPARGGSPGSGGQSARGGAPGLGGSAGSGGSSQLAGSGGRDAGRDLAADTAPDADVADVTASGPAVYYGCDNADKNRLADDSGNGRRGILVGNPDKGNPLFSFVPGRIGNALRLLSNGKTHVDVPVDVFSKAQEVTVATWVQVDKAQAWQRIFDVGINAGVPINNVSTTVYMALVAQDASSHLQLMISVSGADGAQRLTGPVLPLGTWSHVAIVLGPAEAVLYVDGSPVASDNSVLLRPTDLGVIDYAYIGMSQFTVDPYFDGSIDEFVVYRRALRPDEVSALYQRTSR